MRQQQRGEGEAAVADEAEAGGAVGMGGDQVEPEARDLPQQPNQMNSRRYQRKPTNWNSGMATSAYQ